MTANHRALDAADISLIEKVRATPSLYDSSSPDFKFAYRKEQQWENVAAALGMMTAVDARRRWTCLRDRYSRELKQLRLHPEKHEFGNNDFFRQMDFLRKFVRKRRERRRIDSKLKYDSSWDGSNDGNSKMHAKSEMKTTSSDDNIYDDTEDQYDAKLEVSTTEEADQTYQEFEEEEDSQVTENFEEYVETQRPENHTTNTKYAVNAAALAPSGSSTPRYSLSTGSNGTTNIIPIAFLNNSATGNASGQGNNSSNTKFALSNTKSYPANKVLFPQLARKHSTPEPTVSNASINLSEPEDDYFCKTIGSYLRQLSRRHKIKAKVEMFQILEKYIELEESSEACREECKG